MPMVLFSFATTTNTLYLPLATILVKLITSPALAGAGEVLQLVCLFACHTMYIMY